MKAFYNLLHHLFAIAWNNVKKSHWPLLIFISFHFSPFTFSLVDNEYWQSAFLRVLYNFVISPFYTIYMSCFVKLCKSFIEKQIYNNPDCYCYDQNTFDTKIKIIMGFEITVLMNFLKNSSDSGSSKLMVLTFL